MRLETRINIKSSLEVVYKTIINGYSAPIWNPTVNDVKKLEPNIFELDTTFGKLRIVNTQSVENVCVTWHMENSMINSMGFILNKGNRQVEVSIWVEFDDDEFGKGLAKAGDLVLDGLRRYMEFLEDGGNPEDYDKHQVIISA